MHRSTFALMAAAAVAATALACGHSATSPASPSTVAAVGGNAASDGATLKATAPTPLSPVKDQRLQSQDNPTLKVSAASGTYVSVSFRYRFQLFDDTGALVQDSGPVSGTSYTVTGDSLPFDKRFTWRARAEYEGAFGPWSATASFLTINGGYIRGSAVFDPLTNGKTVGKQRGGTFIKGQGWRADSLFDGIDYDIDTCTSCTVEFDVTGVGRKQGESFEKDLKWISMGDAPSFGSFVAFRNTPWKMHLEQRSDGDGTAMKIVWRNGAAGDGEPGDHVQFIPNRVCCGPEWQDNEVFHFVLDYSPSGFSITINGKQWYRDGFGGHAYAPPNQRISLGCYPRGETMMWAIFRNVKVTPH